MVLFKILLRISLFLPFKIFINLIFAHVIVNNPNINLPIMTLQSNPQLELAFEYVRNTYQNIFLTGKAGTGKTTFLHQIKRESVKRTVVVAPTGVAAINAGGMTIHSFFQLPFGPYLPGIQQDATRQRRFTREKIRLIQSLDLLIIDEISMVRADVLDGIDEVLRRYKDRYKPFGGVQLLMIGDLHQLPPVVKEEEWGLLRAHYQTAYFFGSHALQKSAPIPIELKHIYRQSDNTFIALLNKVRDNQLDAAVLETLNSRFVANFQPKEEDAYITLTAHNASAQEINSQKLAAIPKPLQLFKATIVGDFPAYSYPADETLECKTGAQVMFLKNDITREKRYYNGKIGKIVRIQEGTIYVRCPNDDTEIAVSPVEWGNIKYTLNEQTKEVTEETLGTFTQYPLKLAWAITIHKSQGLTFERAIIDAQAAFAHGQVYVALSRCKSFEGIVLRSKIAYSSVKTDPVVKNYSEEADKTVLSEAHLEQSKSWFQQSLIRELFDFRGIRRQFEQTNRVFLENEHTLQPASYQQFKAIDALFFPEVFTVSEKFKPQIEAYFVGQAGLPEANGELQARIQKASAYFEEKLDKTLLPALKNVPILTDNKTVRKSASDALDNLRKEIFVKKRCFGACGAAFSAAHYLRAKADAEIDFQQAQMVPPPPGDPWGVPPNTPHPELYRLLKQWREAAANANGVELFQVLPTKSLLELIQFLPINMVALRKIKGIGPGKSKQFGAELLTLIRQYCAENNLQTEEMALPDAPPEEEKIPKPETKTVSFELFKAGKSIADIAAERGFATSTIEGHLAHFVGLGQLEVFDVMDREKVQELEQFLTEQQTLASGEVKAHFGEKYSYGEIKLVLKYLEWREGEQSL